MHHTVSCNHKQTLLQTLCFKALRPVCMVMTCRCEGMISRQSYSLGSAGSVNASRSMHHGDTPRGCTVAACRQASQPAAGQLISQVLEGGPSRRSANMTAGFTVRGLRTNAEPKDGVMCWQHASRKAGRMPLLIEYDSSLVPDGGSHVFASIELVKQVNKEAAGHVFHERALLQAGFTGRCPPQKTILAIFMCAIHSACSLVLVAAASASLACINAVK